MSLQVTLEQWGCSSLVSPHCVPKRLQEPAYLMSLQVTLEQWGCSSLNFLKDPI